MSIEKSLSDKFWEEKQIDFKLIQALSQKKSISEIFSKLLISRGVFEENYDNFWYQPGAESIEISEFLNTKNKNFIDDKCIMVVTRLVDNY